MFFFCFRALTCSFALSPSFHFISLRKWLHNVARVALYYMGMDINDIFYVIGYVDLIFHSFIADTLLSGPETFKS